MSEEKAAAAAAAEPAPAGGGGGGGSKLTLILTIVNLVVTLGMVAVLVISFKKEKTHPTIDDISTAEPHGEGDAKGGGANGEKGAAPAKKKDTNFGKMIALEQFSINLATPGSNIPKFARVNISVGVPNDDTEQEVTLKMPQVRNTIIDLFNSKRASDLATPEGREYLKEEIRNAINGFLVTGKVKGVYFTNWAITG